jgi:hypothetical protein
VIYPKTPKIAILTSILPTLVLDLLIENERDLKKTSKNILFIRFLCVHIWTSLFDMGNVVSFDLRLLMKNMFLYEKVCKKEVFGH